jgi:enterochelin esterase-like enzyme
MVSVSASGYPFLMAPVPFRRMRTLNVRFRLLVVAAWTALSLQPLTAAAQRQAQPGPTLARLLARVDANDAATQRAFWDSITATSTPLLDDVVGDPSRVLAQFVYRGDTIRNVVLENGVNGWDYMMNQLERVPGTDIWHMTVSVPSDVRLGYVFRTNDDLIPWHLEPDQAKRWAGNRPDPFNPALDTSQGRRSILLGPAAEPDTLSRPQPGTPSGRVDDMEIESRAYGRNRSISVYQPPVSSVEGLGLIVIFDGPVYRRTIRVPAILDNLLAAHAIGPVVAVFVSQVDRNTELVPNAAFEHYVIDELIPYVRGKYRLSTDPAKTIVLGSSHGGLAANWLALAHPETIGNVISESASLWWSPPDDPEPEYHSRLVTREPKKPIRFWVEAGRFEIDRTNGGRPGQITVSRHFRDVLRARGYDVAWTEFPGGHEYQSWRVTLPHALLHFLAVKH